MKSHRPVRRFETDGLGSGRVKIRLLPFLLPYQIPPSLLLFEKHARTLFLHPGVALSCLMTCIYFLVSCGTEYKSSIFGITVDPVILFANLGRDDELASECLHKAAMFERT
jgi:hypothetical protein